jgi:hypothetical protein
MQRARLERLLLVDPVTRRGKVDRLKDSAQAATLGKFRLEGVPPGKIAHFARAR